MKPIADTGDYRSFFLSVKKRIRDAQYNALKAVNKELISLYWDLGRMIVEKQEMLGWGKSVVETLASDLQKEFHGISGFSSANLWRTRNFYHIYQNDEKLAPLVREIGWSHNIIIFEKCKHPAEKEFYLTNTLNCRWTKEILIRQIKIKLTNNIFITKPILIEQYQKVTNTMHCRQLKTNTLLIFSNLVMNMRKKNCKMR